MTSSPENHSRFEGNDEASPRRRRFYFSPSEAEEQANTFGGHSSFVEPGAPPLIKDKIVEFTGILDSAGLPALVPTDAKIVGEFVGEKGPQRIYFVTTNPERRQASFDPKHKRAAASRRSGAPDDSKLSESGAAMRQIGVVRG